MVFTIQRRDSLILFTLQIEDFQPFNDLPFLLTSQVNLLKNIHKISLLVHLRKDNREVCLTGHLQTEIQPLVLIVKNL